MRQFATSPREMLASAWRNRQLIAQMIRREVVGRYRGSFMGIAWSFFNPVLMLAVYTFVFTVAFNARWGAGGSGSKEDFAILLFVGMIVHGLFAECANRAPSLILTNANFVKKVIFPLEILPMIAMGSALFHALVSLTVLMLAMLALNGAWHWTALLLPLVMLPLIIITMGFAWLFASVGVFVRDIAQTIGFLTTIMMFLSPVFYPVSALPERYQTLIMLNPLTFIIEEARAVLVFGNLPDWKGLAIYATISLLVAWGGFWVFQKTRKGFADVL